MLTGHEIVGQLSDKRIKRMLMTIRSWWRAVVFHLRSHFIWIFMYWFAIDWFLSDVLENADNDYNDSNDGVDGDFSINNFPATKKKDWIMT